MKSYFVFAFLITSSLLPAFAKQSELEIELSKIQDPNVNVVNAISQLEKDSNDFINNNDQKKSVDYILNFMSSTMCLQYFTSTLREPKYRSAMELAQKSIMAASEKIGKIEDKVIQGQVNSSAGEIMKKDPLELCRFKVAVDDSLKAEKEKKVKAYAQFKNLMELKKISHPKFVKIIDRLEEQKESLKFGMSSDGIPFIPGDYEYNFVLMYNLQMKINEDESSIIARNLAEKYKLKPVQVYDKYCRGQVKYDSIPVEDLKYLLCADDNLSRSGANCKETFCIDNIPFAQIDPEYTVPLEIKTTAPLLILRQSKDSVCKKNSSFSFKLDNVIIRQITRYSHACGVNDFEKCRVDFSILPSGTTLKAIELMSGSERLRFPSRSAYLQQLVVEDNQKNRYEILRDDYLNLNKPSGYNQLLESNKIIETVSKNKNWDELINKTFIVCDREGILDTLKNTRNLTINYSKVTTQSKISGFCKSVKFNSVIDLQWALVFTDVKIDQQM